MQDQGKRLLLAVVLMLSVLLVWQKLFPPKDEPAPSSAHGSLGATSVNPTSPVGYAEDSLGAAAPGLAAPELITLKYPAFTAVFSSRGGALTSWKLSDSRYRLDATRGELVASPGDFQLGFTKDSSVKLPKNAVWTGTSTDDRHVTYRLSTNDLDITKTYEIVPEAYVVHLTVQVAAKSKAHQRVALTGYVHQDPSDDGGGGSRQVQARVWQSSTLRGGEIVQTPLAHIAESPRLEHNIQWTGFEHPFLLVGFAPRPDITSPVEKHTYAQSNPVLAQAVHDLLSGHSGASAAAIAAAIKPDDPSGLIRTDIVFAPVALNPGEIWRRDVVGYLGPKEVDALERADAAAGFSTGFRHVVDLGWFAFLGKPLLWLLRKFHDLFGNWGIAIVTLTIFVKLVTLYWMTKSMRSMKAMAALGPQIKVLNEKYKDDKQRLQSEMMALYKQHGANPLSGCLPMVLQMPIWIALYRMLSSVGELYRQPFVHGWINDLTIADPYYILPVVLTATMFGQARLTPQNPDPAQQMQQKIMQYGMPLLFGGMAFVFPAGLSLYILTNTCLSALHSIYMNKFDKKSLELSARIKAAQEKAGMDKPGATQSSKTPNSAKFEARSSGESESGDDGEAGQAAKPISRVPVRQRAKKKRR